MTMKFIEAPYVRRETCMKCLSKGLVTLLLVWSLSSVSWSMETAEDSGKANPPIHVAPKMSKSIGPFQLCSDDTSAVIRLQFVGQLRTDWKSGDQGSVVVVLPIVVSRVISDCVTMATTD